MHLCLFRERPQHPHNVHLYLMRWSYDATFGDTDAHELSEELYDKSDSHQPERISQPWHSSVSLCRNSYWLRQSTTRLRLFPSFRSFDSEAPGFASPPQGFASFHLFEALFSSSCQPPKFLRAWCSRVHVTLTHQMNTNVQPWKASFSIAILKELLSRSTAALHIQSWLGRANVQK